MVRIESRSGRGEPMYFASLNDAVSRKVSEFEGMDWAIRRGGRDRNAEEDVLLAGVLLRDYLIPKWQQTQYDRLARGLRKSLPAEPGEDLGRSSALIGERLFHDAGHTCWRAVFGAYQGCRDGISRPHGWLERHDGTILDVTSGQFCRTKILAVSPKDREVLNFYRENKSIQPSFHHFSSSFFPSDLVAEFSELSLSSFYPLASADESLRNLHVLEPAGM